MTPGQRLRVVGASVTFAGVGIALMLIGSPRGKADDRDDRDDKGDPRIEQGFDIAPVPLKFEKEDRKLVGLGSYLVNLGGCNDCHDTVPAAQFVRGGNPFFGQPKKVNPATYLGGGRNFGPISGHLLREWLLSTLFPAT